MTTSRQYVFKVMPRATWEAARCVGEFAGSADDLRDGYIHLSMREQLPGTLAKHFHNQDDLVLVQFETLQLSNDLRWEMSRGGDEFPHLYAPLPTAAALAVHTLTLGADGVPQLPDELTC
ncbi:MAG: DUF952 domain-containing protein [Hyphomicrobium sp.]|jgi:uncharacterized protein (DUF952 family)